MISRILLIGSLIAAFCFAAAPVAKVSSASNFRLRGADVTAAGVADWPLTTGDEIGTGDGVAVISFRDGSRVTLARGTRARLDSDNGTPVFRLLSGALQYSIAAGSALRIYENSNLQAKPAGIVSTTPLSPNTIQSQFDLPQVGKTELRALSGRK